VEDFKEEGLPAMKEEAKEVFDPFEPFDFLPKKAKKKKQVRRRTKSRREEEHEERSPARIEQEDHH
jgi:hypothetical protein